MTFSFIIFFFCLTNLMWQINLIISLIIFSFLSLSSEFSISFSNQNPPLASPPPPPPPPLRWQPHPPLFHPSSSLSVYSFPHITFSLFPSLFHSSSLPSLSQIKTLASSSSTSTTSLILPSLSPPPRELAPLLPYPFLLFPSLLSSTVERRRRSKPAAVGYIFGACFLFTCGWVFCDFYKLLSAGSSSITR